LFDKPELVRLTVGWEMGLEGGNVMTTTDATIRPFEVHVPEQDLVELHRRIEAARPRLN